MELLSGRGNSLAHRLWVGLLVITLFMVDSFVVQGQEPVIFQYNDVDMEVPGDSSTFISAIQDYNITCLGDFQQIAFLPYPGAYSGDLISYSQLAMNGTNGTASGRCLYNTPVQLTQNGGGLTSFSTMFEVYITPGFQFAGTDPRSGNPKLNATLQGLVFIIGGDDSSRGDDGGYLGWLNKTTNDQASGHNFGVEIDFFQDQQFNDPAGVHVGVNNNSLTSLTTRTIEGLGDFLWADDDQSVPDYFCMRRMDSLKDFVLIVWADFDGPTHNLSVYVWWTPVFNVSTYEVSSRYYDVSTISKPLQPLISTIVDLTDTLSREDMFIGFSASAKGDYYIRAWTFNSNGPAPDVQRGADGYPSPNTSPDPSPITPYIPPNKRGREIITIVAATVPSFVVSFFLVFMVIMLYRQNSRLAAISKRYQVQEDILGDQGPQKFRYRALARATKDFDVKAKLGEGGFGSVYKGSLALKKGDSLTDIAVKRISATSKQGEREFLAEVKIIGQAQHRNLVRLLGWCHEKGELLLVYDYMPNGSVYDHLYKKTSRDPVLTWARRMMILSGVAKSLTFLHEEWEHRVIHRDVKSSNVMLDRDFNARLGDFGLARLSEHDKTIPFTEAMAGTYGYIAPELHHTCTPTEKTDVYSFGATMLEVASGKRPLLSQEDKESLNQTLLVDWVWALYRDNALLEAADPALNNAYDPGEMVMFLKIGLLCSHPNPDERPHMREVISIWKGSSPFPPLPLSKPVPVFVKFDSADHSPVRIVSENQRDNLLQEKVEDRNGSPDSTLRFRHTTSSLPF